MEEIIIRHGATEGIRNPSLADVERALADIETCQNERPEFSIEYLGNRREEWLDGHRVTRTTYEGPRVLVARFYTNQGDSSGGWYVVFRDGEQSYALAFDERQDAPFVEGICCGGPLTLRENCIVPVGRVLAAVEPFLSRRERCPVSYWVPRVPVLSD
jgi:hypothetical protein